jgi:hypothetical protein
MVVRLLQKLLFTAVSRTMIVLYFVVIGNNVHAQQNSINSPRFEAWAGPNSLFVNLALADTARFCFDSVRKPLVYTSEAIQTGIDFNTDGIADFIIKDEYMKCGDKPAFDEGTGGTATRFVVSNRSGAWTEHSTLGSDGRVEMVGNIPVWLSAIHRVHCEPLEVQSCIQALFFGGHGFVSLLDTNNE